MNEHYDWHDQWERRKATRNYQTRHHRKLMRLRKTLRSAGYVLVGEDRGQEPFPPRGTFETPPRRATRRSDRDRRLA